LTWTTDPGSRGDGRRNGGHPERPAVEEDVLLDHHIEEMLGTFAGPVGVREREVEAEGRGRE
jgi:hypothetical protein